MKDLIIIGIVAVVVIIVAAYACFKVASDYDDSVEKEGENNVE